MIRYARPQSLEEALRLLEQDSWRVLAGGTDFYPALGAKPLRENVLDINGLNELRGVGETDDHVVIGARTSWTQIIAHPLPPAFDALKLAAREVGSIQIQNTGTVAGNLCNASPAADGVPPLLVLDADVKLRSAGSSRTLPLSEFILGNRSTTRAPNELLTAIHIPKASTGGASTFLKLGARRYLVISIAMAAVRLQVAEGRVAAAAIAVGACSAVAQRLTKLEQALEGLPANEVLSDTVMRHDFAELSPIEDVRGSAGYRRDAAREIVARAVVEAIDGSGRSMAA